jgi:small neutral amino acid transporter SnatA (MarC family)
MNPVSFMKVLLAAFVTLFPLVNPIGDAPIFLALMQGIRRLPDESWHVRLQRTASTCLPAI